MNVVPANGEFSAKTWTCWEIRADGGGWMVHGAEWMVQGAGHNSHGAWCRVDVPEWMVQGVE